MSYLDDFLTQINNRDFSKFLQLWEEYCTSDSVEAEEFIQLLQAIKKSDFAKLFGQFVETALPLWKTIQNETESYEVLKHLIDLQTTNTSILADLSLEAIKKRHGQHAEFNDRLRLIGLRNRDNFQSAMANYDLLAHMGKGKYVFHTGGWGTGEITEVSSVREQLAVEFENVAGRKHITYANAFKTLIPLGDDHFLTRRFSDPDKLEKEAKEDPLAILKVLLRDLGPKNAAEIKDELCDLVIREDDWTKWWQSARAKAKKDTMLETPDSIKGLFRLRKTEVSHEQRLNHAIRDKTNIEEIIQTTYNFVRDMPSMLKKQDVKDSLNERLIGVLKDPSLTPPQELQTLILLDSYFGESENRRLISSINQLEDVVSTVNAIEIIALKKRVLSLIREHRKDWASLFLTLLFTVQQGTLRDYILKELNQGDTRKKLIKELEDLLQHPTKNPELFVWYFQKILSKDSDDLPFADKKGHFLFFESFFILYNAIETKSEYRDLVKKMYNLISGKRFAVVRSILEGSSLEFVKEFLLLVSKCQTLSDHDVKILRSLVEVVHPSLSTSKRKGAHHDTNIIWTTEAGYLKTQARAQQIGTVEIVENAREVEAARALGDLRENSEYKFALEKRSRLQGELKTLSDQLKRARLITRDDVSTSEAGIGNVVELKDQKNKKITYTILGPWDADVDANILSSQSKFAQAMFGLKVGDTFQFRDDEFTVTGLKSYLDK